nr:GntR family transcriptional regulator [bacterium]
MQADLKAVRRADSRLYQQVMHKMRQMILDGTYRSGERLPTESALCELFGVSRITIRRALGQLEYDGYLKRVQGSGTYVSRPAMEQPLARAYRFEDIFAEYGYSGTTKLIQVRQRIINLAERQELSLDEEKPRVSEITRVYYNGDTPVAVEYLDLPCSIFGEVTPQQVTGEDAVHRLIGSHTLGRAVTYRESIGACSLGNKETRLLAANYAAAALSVSRVAYVDEKPLYKVRRIIDAQHYRFVIKLS